METNAACAQPSADAARTARISRWSLSGPTHAVELREAARHVGQIVAIDGGLEEHASWDIGHGVERHLLHLPADGLLRRDIRCVEPRVAQLLQLRNIGPTRGRTQAAAANKVVSAGI